jgi:DNA-binding beta-propeller fold protein YncE
MPTRPATNRLESFRISGRGLVPDRIWPTVRQPNDVAVDEATGQVFVAGTDDDQLQLIDPGAPATAASLPGPPASAAGQLRW